jgi:hypothetical protein
MAVWLQERLLAAMEFDVGDYLKPQKDNNPYIGQLQNLNLQAGLDYIREWHRPEYYEDLFTKNFVKSLKKINIDRWSFLEQFRHRTDFGIIKRIISGMSYSPGDPVGIPLVTLLL